MSVLRGLILCYVAYRAFCRMLNPGENQEQLTSPPAAMTTSPGTGGRPMGWHLCTFLCRCAGQRRAVGTGLHAPAASLSCRNRCLPIIHTAHVLINPHTPSLHRKKTHKQHMTKLFSPNSSPAYACIYIVVCIREQALLVFAGPCPWCLFASTNLLLIWELY